MLSDYEMTYNGAIEYLSIVCHVNPFIPNNSLSLPPKTSENRKVF